MARSGRPLKVQSELEYLDVYIEENDLKGIEYLIEEHGVDCYDAHKRTLLIKAAFKGNIDILKFMIEKGADINFQDKIGYSALHFSAQNRLPEIATILIENGADINIQDSYGNPPIWTAIFNAKGDFTLLEMLLKAGASLNGTNISGKTPREIGETMLGASFTELLNKYK